VKDAIIYRAREVNPLVTREVTRLAQEVPSNEIFIVCYRPEYESAQHSTPGKVYNYGQRDLHSLPYPEKLCKVDWANPSKKPRSEYGSEAFFYNLEYGHHDLPVLKFFLDQPGFDRYWLIEDDVRCSESWTPVFEELNASNADLLMTAVQNFSEVPTWHWWTHMKTGKDVLPVARRVKGFLPFCRMSAACLQAIDEKYRQGWCGHYEVTWSNIALASGLTIEDIGGEGSYTPAERRGRYYSCTMGNPYLFPGTFIFRPPFHEMGESAFGKGVTPNYILWHPVKA
jgi:hypothetical protein